MKKSQRTQSIANLAYTLVYFAVKIQEKTSFNTSSDFGFLNPSR